MKYIIRKARLTDLEKVIDLATEMAPVSVFPMREAKVEDVKNYRRKDLHSLYGGLYNSNLGIFVAENADGEFMGHVLVSSKSDDSTTGDSQGFIFDLSVVKEHQRSGVGAALMKTAEEFCILAGVKHIALNVTSSNEKAVNFYKKIGYFEERKTMIKILEPQKD